MVTTASEALAGRLRTLRSHGMVRPEDGDPWWYEMPEIGFNYRLPDVLCALGLSQLKKLDGFVARRRALAHRYAQRLEALAPLVEPAATELWSDPALHLMTVLIDFEAAGRTRAAVVEALKAKGVGSQVHYIPVHTQPYYRNRYGAGMALPGAEAWYRRCLSLPLYPAMADDDVDRVVDALAAAIGVNV
jgi:dTDP-4-amino-4,6-dideoxygalactose transaminase